MQFVRTLVIAVATGGLSAAALAQTPIQPPRDPNMPAPKDTIPEKIVPQDPSTTGSTGSNGTLSDKLEKSDGVIKPPPNIGSGMVVKPPETGTMPVIPPPGSPGGNQRLEPK
jgi:hypothetical protein